MNDQRASSRFSEITLPIALFIATLGTTFWAGFVFNPGSVAEKVTAGVAYSLPLMAILLTHEMGHYLTARRLGVPVSLPFFLPLPIGFLGTLGAVIRLRDAPPDRSTLLKIGAAGPIAGGVVAFAVMAAGILTSTPAPRADFAEAGFVIEFGESVMTLAFQRLFWADLPDNMTLIASPMYTAGWAGFLITMLNLIPLGQLDGGHIGYAALGSWLAKRWWLVVLTFVGLGVVAFAPYIIFMIIAIVFGRHHFRLRDEHTPLDRSSRWLVGISVVLFALTFMPAPIHYGLFDILTWIEAARVDAILQAL